MKIDTTTKAEYLELIEIWDASVRAIHDFLSDKDISSLKPLGAVDLSYSLFKQ